MVSLVKIGSRSLSGDARSAGGLSARTLVAGIGVVLALLIVGMSVTAAIAFNQLKVGGSVYNSIFSAKDLLADIRPPVLTPVQAYSEVLRIQKDPSHFENGRVKLYELFQQYNAMKDQWQSSSLPEAVKAELGTDAIAAFWSEVQSTFLPAMEKGDAAASNEALARLEKIFLKIDDSSVRAEAAASKFLEDRVSGAGESSHHFLIVLVLLGSALAAGFVGAYLVIQLHMVQPISQLRDAMLDIGAGKLESEVPVSQRVIEFVRMGQSLINFQKAALERIMIEKDAAEARQAAEREREKRDQEKLDEARETQAMTTALATGLNRVASGDLQYQINDAFPARGEELRRDFNGAVAKLAETLRSVVEASRAINGGTNEIASASDDLSRRTEQQAASLEETAAALDQITATVTKMAEGAQHAHSVVSAAKADAEHGGDVVRQAIDAMDKIDKSSQQISQIIGVIDEIAFQTNLLALNAGVEAARAGEAGRGFAVVASEVRALAQRSANAAKEIKELISTSTQQVGEGVKRVNETGHSLTRIVKQVSEINGVVADIAASAHEQSTGLRQVNIAVNSMDQATQQNAAMAEEATAASRSLSQECEQLTMVVSQFNVGAAAEVRVQPAAPKKAFVATSQPRELKPIAKTTALSGQSPRRPNAPAAKVKAPVRKWASGGTAAAEADWKEF